MKTTFESFLAPDVDSLKSAWSCPNTIFVFDTNVFLNLYGYEDQTRTDFFNTALKLKEKIWIPHHVGLEYHRNRLKVIKREKKVFRDIYALLEKINTSINSELNKLSLAKKFPEINTHLQDLASSIRLHVDNTKNAISPWDIKQADVRSNDKILESLDEITHDRIGSPPDNQQWLDDLYEEGKLRYAEKIPPGFEDIPKAEGEREAPIFTHGQLKYERAFGDLIIWKQLLSKAGTIDVKNVFFITDDAKKDWWSIIDSAGDKIIGPHESLKSEICRMSNVDFFHMYSTSDFLKDGKQFLNTEILDSSINDAYEKNEFTVEEEENAGQDDPKPDETDKLKEILRIASLLRRSEYSNEVNFNQKSSNIDFVDRKKNSNHRAFAVHFKDRKQTDISTNTLNNHSSSERDIKQKDAKYELGTPTPNPSSSQIEENQYNEPHSNHVMEPSKLECTDDGVE